MQLNCFVLAANTDENEQNRLRFSPSQGILLFHGNKLDTPEKLSKLRSSIRRAHNQYLFNPGVPKNMSVKLNKNCTIIIIYVFVQTLMLIECYCYAIASVLILNCLSNAS